MNEKQKRLGVRFRIGKFFIYLWYVKIKFPYLKFILLQRLMLDVMGKHKYFGLLTLVVFIVLVIPMIVLAFFFPSIGTILNYLLPFMNLLAAYLCVLNLADIHKWPEHWVKPKILIVVSVVGIVFNMLSFCDSVFDWL